METIRLAPCKKNAKRLAAHLVFIDESGFLLIPPVRKTWSPVGPTPVLIHRYRHDRISAILALPLARGASIVPCTANSMRTIFRAKKWRHSSAICCIRYAATGLFCSTMARFIVVIQCRSFSPARPVYTWSLFRRTPLN